MESALHYAVLQAQHRMDRVTTSRIFRDSSVLIMEKAQQIDLRMRDAEDALNRALIEADHRLKQINTAVTAYNPEAVLKRGYAIVRDASGKTVDHVSAVQTGDALEVQLAGGRLQTTVDGILKKTKKSSVNKTG